MKKLFDSIFSLLKALVFTDFFIKIPPAEKSNCAIVGTGPSLKISLKDDLAFIQNCELFCLNLFSKTEYFEQLKPKNYLLLDPIFLNSDTKFVQETLDAINQKTNWNMNLFVPRKFLKSTFFISKISNPMIKIVPFNYTIARGFTWFTDFLFGKNWGMPQSQNVMIASLFYAINMGFKKIYLFGADHSWHEDIRLNENNEIEGRVQHFYEEKNQKAYSPRLMSQQFLSLYKVFFGYEILAKYAEKKNVKIYNASAKSYIDVFEKVKLN